MQVSDLRTVVPDLNMSGQRRNDVQFFIRGQGPGPQGLCTRNYPSVTAYFAEVPASLTWVGHLLRPRQRAGAEGAPGTLFGRNTTGGAVLIEPARPTDEFTGYLQQTFGDYRYRETEGMVKVPIAGYKAAFRIAAQISRRDGFTRSIVTGQRLDGRSYDAVRGSLVLRPPSNLENLTIIDYRSENDSGQSEILNAVYRGAQLSSLTTPAALAPLLGLPAGTTTTIPIRVGGAVSVGCLTAALPGCPTGSFRNAVAAFQAAYHGGAPAAQRSYRYSCGETPAWRSAGNEWVRSRSAAQAV